MPWRRSWRTRRGRRPRRAPWRRSCLAPLSETLVVTRPRRAGSSSGTCPRAWHGGTSPSSSRSAPATRRPCCRASRATPSPAPSPRSWACSALASPRCSTRSPDASPPTPSSPGPSSSTDATTRKRTALSKVVALPPFFLNGVYKGGTLVSFCIRSSGAPTKTHR